jgi:hypothetical protein
VAEPGDRRNLLNGTRQDHGVRRPPPPQRVGAVRQAGVGIDQDVLVPDNGAEGVGVHKHM